MSQSTKAWLLAVLFIFALAILIIVVQQFLQLNDLPQWVYRQ